MILSTNFRIPLKKIEEIKCSDFKILHQIDTYKNEEYIRT